MAVLLAAAMPVRVFHSLPLANSASILDLLVIIVAATLFLDLAFRPLDLGYPRLFWLLCLPLVISILSIVWSQDHNATLRVVLSYAEGVIVYLFVIRELASTPAARIMTYIRRFSYLVIIPAVLLLLHVPGFAPPATLDRSSGDYITYYVGLSHPVLGASNNLATVLAFFAPILLYWGHARNDRRATIAGLISSVAIVLTLSRGVLLAFLIAGLLFAPLAVERRTTAGKGLGAKIAAALALGLVAIGVFYVANAPTQTFFQGRLSSKNVESRLELYSQAFRGIEANPLLGLGGGAELSSPSTQSDSQLSTLDLYNAAAAEPIDTRVPSPVHNTYLQQALNFGLPLGLLVSLALCGTVGFFLGRRRTTALAGVIAYSLMVQLISFLFESSFEGTVLRILFYMSVGLATALLRAVEAESPVPPGGKAPKALIAVRRGA